MNGMFYHIPLFILYIEFVCLFMHINIASYAILKLFSLFLSSYIMEINCYFIIVVKYTVQLQYSDPQICRLLKLLKCLITPMNLSLISLFSLCPVSHFLHFLKVC